MRKRFQLLHSLITLEADSDSLRNEFEFASQDAVQCFRASSESIIRVRELKNAYRLEMADRSFQTAKDPWELGYGLLSLAHLQAFNDYGECLRIHAACVDYQDSRLIFTGPKAAGKTSLIMRLLFERQDFQVSGDELVIIEGEQGIPFPRRFHIKTGSLKLLPAIAPYVKNCPRFKTAPKSWLYGFSPAEAGFAWEIKPRKIDAVFYITPDHGAESCIKEISGLEMTRNILPMCYGPATDDALRIQRLCGLINQVKTYELRLGNLDNISQVLQNKLTST